MLPSQPPSQSCDIIVSQKINNKNIDIIRIFLYYRGDKRKERIKVYKSLALGKKMLSFLIHCPNNFVMNHSPL